MRVRGIMIFVLVVCLLVCVAVHLRVRWGAVRRYWADKGVPHAPPHPLLGSLTFLMKQNPALWMRQLYDRFRTPYIGIWLFWRPALVITSPELARRILVADCDSFRDRHLGSRGATDPIGALNLFMVNEPTWSAVRRRLSPAFTSAKLKMVESLVQSKCAQLVRRIRTDTEKNLLIDLRAMYSDMSTDIITISGFGIDGDATLEGTSAMREVTKEFMKYNWYRGVSWASIFFFPELVDAFRFKFLPKKSTDFFRQIFAVAVSQRGGYGRPVRDVRDFLDALLKMKQDAAKDGEDLSEDLLVAQAAIFLQAGFDSTGSALAYCTYELAHAPASQNKLHAELTDAERRSQDRLSSKTLSELPYLNAVINETLRKYPIMGWLDRVAAVDYDIDETLRISAGTPVYVNACSTHYDPEYFPDPELFFPGRFLPENEHNIKQYTFIPFGHGPRHCIGMRLALQVIRHCLAAVTLHYKLQPLPNSPSPNEVPIEKNGLLLLPGETLRVVFVDRNE